MTDPTTRVAARDDAREGTPHDLTFTLLVRLPDGMPPPEHPWRTWPRAHPQSASGSSVAVEGLVAHKRYPGGREYFAPQVAAALFPAVPPTRSRATTAGRWIRDPVSASLQIGGEDGLPAVVLAIELLEVVKAPLRPDVTFGVVHLSARAKDGGAMLRCSKLLSTRWRQSQYEGPRFAVACGSAETVIIGQEPLRALAIHLFGDAHPNVMHRAHIFVAARLPVAVAPTEEPAWRRALGRGHTLEEAATAFSERRGRDDHRTEQIGGATATFFGRSTALTHRLKADAWVYNVRSYWSEAVLFALIQQSYLETYAEALRRLGAEPLSKPVDELFRDWVAFRNVLWWRDLSYTTDVPGRVNVHVHRELNTASLFAELEQAFATYVEARRHRTEDAERVALRGLQVYGAAFAVVSSAAAVTQIATAEALGLPPWTVYALAIVFGTVAGLLTRALLEWRQR